MKNRKYLIVLDAYCPGRQSLCYHLALRSDDCNRLIHGATWNTHTLSHVLDLACDSVSAGLQQV